MIISKAIQYILVKWEISTDKLLNLLNKVYLKQKIPNIV